MVAGADWQRHDVDVDRKQAALPDCPLDLIDQRLAIPCWHALHGVLYPLGAPLEDSFELGGIQRGLEVVAAPVVVDAAQAADQQLVDMSGWAADMGV